jgi:holliday junction DNA helicase RuvB
MTIYIDGGLAGQDVHVLTGETVISVPRTGRVRVNDDLTITSLAGSKGRPALTDFSEFAARMGVKVKPPKPVVVREASTPASRSKATRPTDMATMVGQDRLRVELTVHISASKTLGKPIEHILLQGPPGLGKTSIAMLVAEQSGGELVLASGDALKTPETLVNELGELQDGDVYFVDEIHGLPERVKRTILTAMEDGRVDVGVGTGSRSTVESKMLHHFILVGATTEPGKLPQPLLDRFALRGTLEYYTAAELTEILVADAERKHIKLEQEAAQELAHRSRCTPRIALNLLSSAHMFAVAAGDSADVPVTMVDVNRALEMKDIDHNGLTKHDRAVLWTLCKVHKGGPVGMERLAMGADIDNRTLESIESYLVRAKLLIGSRQGRVATNWGFEAVGLEAPVTAPCAEDLEMDE